MDSETKRDLLRTLEFPRFAVPSNFESRPGEWYDSWVAFYNEKGAKPIKAGEIAKAYAGIMELYRSAVSQWDSSWSSLKSREPRSETEEKMLSVVFTEEHTKPSDRRGYALVGGPLPQWVEGLNQVRDGLSKDERERAAYLARLIRAYIARVALVQSLAWRVSTLELVLSAIVRQGEPASLQPWRRLTINERFTPDQIEQFWANEEIRAEYREMRKSGMKKDDAVKVLVEKYGGKPNSMYQMITCRGSYSKTDKVIRQLLSARDK